MYPLLEFKNLFIGQSISLSDDRDEIDFGMKSAHEFDIKLLEAIIAD